jgi:predicted RNase H-like HicB family nuclease
VKLYRLSIVLREPDGETGGKFLAEVPALPGCRAWGDTAAETIENLQSVATAFIESYREHGDPLPADVEALGIESNRQTPSEMLVAVAN